ncbi:MAG TPA: sigma-70 family RNA polymerase sigma factor [Pirellulales bacterium]|jgi:RNA polymerase sigma-70 factor (ECF subfamily)
MESVDWPQIVAEHGPLVWRIALRLLDHEADAADCFQRTFVSALEVASNQKIRQWPALLRKLATSRALEQLRQRIQQRNRFAANSESTDINSTTDQKTGGPETHAEANEFVERLRAALGELEPRHAEVFCLACLDDCSYAEIAEQLGIEANYVGVILSRAKAQLRKLLPSDNPTATLHAK